MSPAESSFALRARYVFSIDSPPIENAEVVVRNGTIESIGPSPPNSKAEDLGDVALLPAFVNAHTHLEFSSLPSPLAFDGFDGEGPGEFTDWIGHVLSYRRDRDANASNASLQAVQCGLVESQAAGVGWIGEIATSDDWPTGESLPGNRVRGVRFLELIGLSRDRVANQKTRALSFLSKQLNADWSRGLSPHAPYTAARELVEWSAHQSREKNVPLAMHLAETEEELQLLADQSGPFYELLQSRQVWNADAFQVGLRPLDYLRLLSAAARVLVIHGNYLKPDEWRFMAEQRETMSVVYCPRTHSYFGHAEYPLHKMISAGVLVAIGTDSRASNPDLSIWNELRFIASQHPEVAPQTVLRMGTVHGAKALGCPGKIATIRSGSVARLIAIRLREDCRTTCPYEWLFASDGEIEWAS